MDENKTYSQFKGEWILNSPEPMRIALLQGIADGDGYASVLAQNIDLYSIKNARSIYQLLKSLDIESYLYPRGVVIHKHESLLKAASTRIFRNAIDKTENLTELCKMIIARPKRKPVSSDEIKVITKQAKKGLSSGRIAYHLWMEYKISRSPSTITIIVKKNK